MDIEKQVYLDAQKACDLKVGDYVKVISKAESFQAGWNDIWKTSMDNLIGRIGKVTFFDKNQGAGIQVSFPNTKFDYCFPYYVLTKVDKSIEFKEYTRVLVRDSKERVWRPDIFLYYNNDKSVYKYICTKSHYVYCIPYKGNEALNGTTKEPIE